MDGFIVSDEEEDNYSLSNESSDDSIKEGSDSSDGVRRRISDIESDSDEGVDTDEEVITKPRKKSRRKTQNSSEEEHDDSDGDSANERWKKNKNKFDFFDEDTDDSDEKRIKKPRVLKKKRKVHQESEEEDIENFSSSGEENTPKKKKRKEIDSEEEREKEMLFGLNPNGKTDIRSFLTKTRVDSKSLSKRRDAAKYHEEKQKNVEKNLKTIPKAERLVNVGKEEDEDAVYFQPQLFSILKPHQIEGIRFLWDHIITPKKDSLKGCILAHSMGLGKTLQVCAFTEMAIRSNSAKTVLILCPKSVVENWDIEYKKWANKTDISNVRTYPISKLKLF